MNWSKACASLAAAAFIHPLLLRDLAQQLTFIDGTSQKKNGSNFKIMGMVKEIRE